MKREAISMCSLDDYGEEETTKTGQWFDIENAKCYKEGSCWNRQNRISKITGSQHHHEYIYITKGGVFILNSWTNWAEIPDTYMAITKEQAAAWFVKNEYSDAEIPEIFKGAVSNLEIN